MSKKKPQGPATTRLPASKPATGEGPLVAAVATLIKALHDEDPFLGALRDRLQEFSDTWLKTGDTIDWPGVNHCCLADCDLVEALLNMLDERLDQDD